MCGLEGMKVKSSGTEVEIKKIKISAFSVLGYISSVSLVFMLYDLDSKSRKLKRIVGVLGGNLKSPSLSGHYLRKRETEKVKKIVSI